MVLEGLENRKHTEGVFLDLSKALDCVDYEALLDKLNSHGVWGIPLLWLKPFLSNRGQVVNRVNTFSDSIKLSYDVPQRSILSTALFLVYVNDIGSSLRYGKLLQYTDYI